MVIPVVSYRVIGTKSPNHVTRGHRDYPTFDEALHAWHGENNWTAVSLWQLWNGRRVKAIILNRRWTEYGEYFMLTLSWRQKLGIED